MTRILALALLAAGCAAAPPAEPVPVRGGGSCDASKAQSLIGRGSDDDLAEDALRLSRARIVRFVPEGGMVTMDFREDRVNLHLDRGNKVKKVACG